MEIEEVGRIRSIAHNFNEVNENIRMIRDFILTLNENMQGLLEKRGDLASKADTAVLFRD